MQYVGSRGTVVTRDLVNSEIYIVPHRWPGVALAKSCCMLTIAIQR